MFSVGSFLGGAAAAAMIVWTGWLIADIRRRRKLAHERRKTRINNAIDEARRATNDLAYLEDHHVIRDLAQRVTVLELAQAKRKG